jgi:hypothetical protein
VEWVYLAQDRTSCGFFEHGNESSDCTKFGYFFTPRLLVPVAVRSKAWACGRSFAGISGSIPNGGVDVCCECCVVR